MTTYRDTDLDRTHPLAEMLADLRRAPGVERLALSGLDEDGVAQFLERTAGHELDDAGLALARAVHAETEGNPFFVGEVLRHLSESGAIVFRDGRWTSDLTIEQVGIPEGVREVVGRRLSNLEPAVNDVLVVASVIGRDFDVAMLAAVCDGGEEAVLDALEAAEARGLVTPVTGRAAQYRFAHALVRSTLYDELTTSRRLRLHRSVARALVGRPDAETRLPELARHFSECAALGEIDRAVEYCRRAGNAAREELAFEEAADYYERSLGALELADQPDAALRADLLVAAGVALVTIGDSRGRELLYEAARLAREIGDAARLADAAIELQLDTHTREVTAVDEKLVALLDEALDALDVDDFERRALLLSGLTAELMWTEDSPRRERLSGEALATTRRAGTPRVVGRALFIQQFGYDHTSLDMDRYSAEGAEMIELARAVDDPILLSWGYYHRIVGSFYRGDRAQLDIDIDASLELTGAIAAARARSTRARATHGAHAAVG